MRIGTRGSALALAQARLVADSVQNGRAGHVEIVPLVTSGDRGEALADKSRWVAELEDALLRGQVDIAVHSAKDVPGALAEGLSLLGAPARAGVEDVLCGVGGTGRAGRRRTRRHEQHSPPFAAALRARGSRGDDASGKRRYPPAQARRERPRCDRPGACRPRAPGQGVRDRDRARPRALRSGPGAGHPRPRGTQR